MASIYEFVEKSYNRRPVYTSYELSKKVRDKREKSGLNISDFSAEYGIDSELLVAIENANRSFSPKMYKACGKILDLTTDELLEEIVDDEKSASYRATDNRKYVQGTFEMANRLFNEIIMQKKIGIN